MTTAKEILTDNTNEDLLQRYLSLTASQREQEFLSTSRAAKSIGVSARTIQLWIEGGKIKAILIGGKYKVHLGSLLAYIKSRLDGQ